MDENVMDEKNKLKIRMECPYCGEIRDIFMTLEEYVNYELYLNGYGLIQQMLPNIPAPDRELLKGGMCGKCWKEKIADPICEEAAFS